MLEYAQLDTLLMLTFPVLRSYVTCPDPLLFWSDALVISGDIWHITMLISSETQQSSSNNTKTGTRLLMQLPLNRDFFSQNQTPRVLNAYFDRTSTTDGYIKAWGPNPPSKPVTNEFSIKLSIFKFS